MLAGAAKYLFRGKVWHVSEILLEARGGKLRIAALLELLAQAPFLIFQIDIRAIQRSGFALNDGMFCLRKQKDPCHADCPARTRDPFFRFRYLLRMLAARLPAVARRAWRRRLHILVRAS